MTALGGNAEGGDLVVNAQVLAGGIDDLPGDWIPTYASSNPWLRKRSVRHFSNTVRTA
jgi:hypothetical protein